MNNQKPEPFVKDADGMTLDVHSIFYTIQGEGPHTGRRAVFIRLAGCNLQCPGCDTEYTQGRKLMDLDMITTDLFSLLPKNSKLFDLEAKDRDVVIVITGGEPLRQPIGTLVQILIQDYGFRVQIESNGMFEPDAELKRLLALRLNECMLVISPKTPKINREAAELAHCFKYVLSADSIDPDDGLPIYALEHNLKYEVARPPKRKPVYINPYDAKDEEANKRNLQAAAKSAMDHGYILGVQLHKLVGLE